MGEETLEINTLDSEEGLFDDYVAEETTETTESEATEPETTEAEEPAESQEAAEETTEEIGEIEEQIPFELDVKFNGEERVLTKDEARTLAQKGMNYDRFYEPLERLARMNNMSVGDYINRLNDTQVQFEVEKEISNLRNDPKYENVGDDILEEIANARVRDQMGQREQYFADQSRQQAEAEQARAKREIDLFMEEYPEFKNKGPESLDPKVFEFVKQGYTLLEAYNKFQRMNAQRSNASAKEKVSQLNEANRKKSIGNTSTSGSSNDGDAFLSGFNSY